MGKHKHSKDKLYIVQSEYASEWGGYKTKPLQLPYKALPFFCWSVDSLLFSKSHSALLIVWSRTACSPPPLRQGCMFGRRSSCTRPSVCPVCASSFASWVLWRCSLKAHAVSLHRAKWRVPVGPYEISTCIRLCIHTYV